MRSLVVLLLLMECLKGDRRTTKGGSIPPDPDDDILDEGPKPYNVFDDRLAHYLMENYNSMTPEQRIAMSLKLGQLAVYFRLHKKYIKYASTGYEFGYPSLYEWDDTIARPCKNITDKSILVHCVQSIHKEVSATTSWLNKGELSLDAETVTNRLENRYMTRDLTISQLLCYLTMAPGLLVMKYLPYCRYDVGQTKDSKGQNITIKWNYAAIRNRTNGSPFELFDEVIGDDYECATKSFCPDPCAETDNLGHPLFVCPRRGKCSLPRELNSYLTAMRKNDWNESCPCTKQQYYRADTGTCVLKNMCFGYDECNSASEICMPSMNGPRCVCQLGFYRNGSDVCVKTGFLDQKWYSLGVAADSSNSLRILTVPLILILLLVTV